MTAHCCVASATEPMVSACASSAENHDWKKSSNACAAEPFPNAFLAA